MNVRIKNAAPDGANIESSSGEQCVRADIRISVNDCNTGKGRTQDAGRLFLQIERAGRREQRT